MGIDLDSGIDKFFMNLAAEKDMDIIRNGIDTDNFVPKGGAEQKIVHISRLDLDRSKTAELLIALAPELAKLDLCQNIMIVGNGDDCDFVVAVEVI